MSRDLARVLREQEVRHKAVFDAIVDAVVLVDSSGVIETANTSAERVHGYQPGELIGKSFLIFVPEPFRALAYGNFKSYVETGLPPLADGSREAIGLRKDGSTFPVDLTITEVRIGRRVTFVLSVHDLTRHNQLEMHHANSYKMEGLGRMAAGIAHQYNNLLAIIMGNAELIRDTPTSLYDVDICHSVSRIQGAAQRAADYTHKLLAFTSAQKMDTTLINCNDFLASIAEYVRPLLGNQIEVTLDTPEVPALTLADHNLLKQVIVSLAVNAGDAMPNGGPLKIHVENITGEDGRIPSHIDLGRGNYVLISVCDTGIGMSDEVRTRAFEPFFTTKPVGAGTGLGLAESYGIIKQAGGDIWFSSDSFPGSGTTIRLCLPSATPPISPSSQFAAPHLTHGSRTIIVMEEDPLLRMMTINTLNNHGYRALGTATRTEALRVLESESDRYDLIIADASMVFLGSSNLAQRFYMNRPDVPIIVCSGYEQDVFASQLAQLHMSAFLTKPFTSCTLLKLVDGIFDSVPVYSSPSHSN